MKKIRDPEYHLFLLWEKASPSKEKILEDIKKNFMIVEIYNILWDSDNFTKNLSRFYGQRLVNGSEKEVECGRGRFTMVGVIDNSPVYKKRKTSAGVKVVNANMFDAKTRYRKWTGGGHKIHATNDVMEAKRDLYLLINKEYKTHLTDALKKPRHNLQSIDKDINLNGCIQWGSLCELFGVLNSTVRYVVLRNFDQMPQKYYADAHGDIDILVDHDPKEVALLMNASPVYPRKKYRVHYVININGYAVRFDIRYVGDSYYCKNWARNIINRRVWKKGFFVPSKEDYQYSLLYHALVHKPLVNQGYMEKFINMGFDSDKLLKALDQYMIKKQYAYTEPSDFSVYYNAALLHKKISFYRMWHQFKGKIFELIGSYINPKIKIKLKNMMERF